MADVTRRIGLSLGADLCWPICFEEILKRLNLAFCLITEKLSELSERLVNNPHVAAIEIPLPNAEERQEFISVTMGPDAAARLGTMSVEGLAQNSAGLSLVNLSSWRRLIAARCVTCA